MYVSFLEHKLKLCSWTEKHQMIKDLADCDAGSVILGEGIEAEREFHSVIVQIGYSGFRKFGVGIISHGQGIAPSLLLVPATSTLVVGFNSDVAGVRIPDGKLMFSATLDSVFYRFLPSPDESVILVQHEIGVVALSQVGETLWRFSRDIITHVATEKNQLYLEFMDSPPVYLDLLNGGKSKPA